MALTAPFSVSWPSETSHLPGAMLTGSRRQINLAWSLTKDAARFCRDRLVQYHTLLVQIHDEHQKGIDRALYVVSACGCSAVIVLGLR